MIHPDEHDCLLDTVSELRAKLDTLDADLAKTLVALDNEVARSTTQLLRAEKAEAKLDAAERTCAEVRAVLQRARLEPGGQIWRDWCDRIMLSDAGRDYVPRSEVDAAWRKGMTDAAMIARGFTESMGHYKSMQTAATIESNILAARDAKFDL